ncbi:MAG: hypothetical protein JWL71_2824 [Acidobacteria bacterium]|nr:hypothetical protein [Acidobacteriota bacterium]
MSAHSDRAPNSTALSSHLLAHVLEIFFADARMLALRSAPGHAGRDTALVGDRFLEFNWSGLRYGLERERPFTVLERVLFEAIADVVGDRPYASIPGRLEDVCVATFLAPPAAGNHRERSVHIRTVMSAIVALRAAARSTTGWVTTTGVIVEAGSHDDDNAPAAELRVLLPLCDGFSTVVVVSRTGAIVGLRALDQRSSARVELPYPVAQCHIAHAAATADGDDLCLILDASGHIQLFSRGVHLFSWADGRWLLRDGEADAG